MQPDNFYSKSLSKASRFVALAFFIIVVNVSGCEADYLWSTQTTEATSATARVIKVKDGDSVILRYTNGLEKEARLFGIDAPEYDQPYGRDAKRILEKLVLKQSVQIGSLGEDRYKREIVLLRLEGESASVNFEMIRLGAAWIYRKYQDDETWQSAQTQAKKKRKGLWSSDQAMAPWDWRKK